MMVSFAAASLVRGVRTHSAAEGNVSRTLGAMVIDSVKGLSEQRQGDK